MMPISGVLNVELKRINLANYETSEVILEAAISSVLVCLKSI